MNLLNVTDVSHDYPHHPGVLRDVSLNVRRVKRWRCLDAAGAVKAPGADAGRP